MPLGQKKPLNTKQVKILKSLLSNEPNKRDICLFCVQLDTMLRSSDILNLKVSDIIDSKGNIKEEITVKQQKTKKTVSGVIQQDTQKYLKEYLKDSDKNKGDYLYSAKKRLGNKRLTSMGHHKIVKRWFSMLDINVNEYATHTLRRTKASIIYKKTNNIAVVAELLGHINTSATSRYLGIQKSECLEIAKSIQL